MSQLSQNLGTLSAPERAENLPVVALVGISGYGRVHLKWLELMVAKQGLHFVAAVVINPDEEREACARLRALGVRVYQDWRVMLEAWKGELDLCLVPVPIHLHAEVTVAALEAGANVLVEKPLAATVGQAQAIQAAEHRTGRWVAVGYQDFYSTATIKIAAQLAAGRIGRIRSVRWLGLWPRTEDYYRRNQWAGRLALQEHPVRDSPLNNAMAHYLNLALYWAGVGPNSPASPEKVQAELFRCYPIENFDTAVARFYTTSGVMIQAAVSHCCETDQPIRIHVHGDEGELLWVHRRKAHWMAGGGEVEKVDLGGREEAMNAMFAAVLERLRSPGARICTSAHALPQVAAVEALPSEVRVVSPTWLEEFTDDGESRLVVRNIAQDLKECLSRGALPSELRLAWAGPTSMATA